ncbi:MAG: Ig-like domain-containing protein, partial [Patescibacteria group bacterium]
SATGRLLDANFTWPVPSSVYTVNDSSTLCKIARVEIQPASDIFTCSGDSCTDDVQPAIPLPAGPAGNQHQYTVAAYDINNRSIGLQAPWVWTQGDSGGSGNPSNVYTQGATGSICPGNATSSVYCSQSLNVPSGSEQLNVSVVGTGGSGTGTASINVQSFLCAKPWPAAGSFPFRDPVRTDLPTNQSHNFTFGFCADNLQGVSLSDPVQSPSLPGEPNLTKEYFMLVKDKDNNPTGDSIGIRIFGSTPEGYTTDLSPKRWYKQRFGKESTGTTLEVDGYPALREGRTVYVVADNYLAASGNSYPNVYVISYNDKASSETQSIFDQVLKNLKFNEIIPTPLPLPLLTNLRADLKRIHAMQELVFGLADYYQVKKANPTLDTGSYIKNMSFSAWPSWQSLGSTLGITMPQDPEVLWKPSSTLCGTGFDQGSCWNQVSKVMQFPSDSADPPESHGFAYKYVPGNPPLVPPSVQLYGTGSANIQNHDTTLISFPSPATSICPTTLPPAPVNSCLGFNFGVNASNFGQMSDWRLPSAADTTAPTPVTIDSPVNNDTVSGAVPFVITASDETGGSGMQRVAVKIKRGTTIVASTSIGAPDKDGKYRWTWSSRLALNSPPDYDVTVTAFDKAGNSQAAPNLQLTLTNPPADSEPPIITASAPSTTWNGSASIVVSATATDVHPTATNNTKVVKIEFYLGSSKLGQAPDPMCAANCPDSYTANVTIPATTIRGFPNGSYTYSVVAYDGFGNTSIKNYPVTIDKTSPDSTPPQILITLPTGTVSGANTDVVATATDASGIDRVEFLIDGIPKTVDFSGPYSFSWLLNGYAEGPHTITAVAYDRYGNQATATQTVTYMVVTGPDTQRPTITDVTATLDTNVSIPLEGAQLSNRVTLNATLTDNVAIHRAELRIDGVKIPLIGGAYYCDTPQNCILAYSWDTLPETVGQHTVSITAYDTAGYVVTVTQIVNVVNQVIMTISSPQSGTTVKDLPAGSTCSNNPTKTCTTNRDCPLVKVGSCELTGIKCYNDPICAGANPGDFCNRPLGSCNATPAGIPVVIDVTRTCSTDLTLSSVQFFLDSSPTPLPGSATCTSGRCTYTWNSKTTTSNGS